MPAASVGVQCSYAQECGGSDQSVLGARRRWPNVRAGGQGGGGTLRHDGGHHVHYHSALRCALHYSRSVRVKLLNVIVKDAVMSEHVM